MPITIRYDTAARVLLTTPAIVPTPSGGRRTDERRARLELAFPENPDLLHGTGNGEAVVVETAHFIRDAIQEKLDREFTEGGV